MTEKTQQTKSSSFNAVIKNYRGTTTDITDIVGQLEIHESLDSETTMGKIFIVDSEAYEERIPIIGQESIVLTFESHLHKGDIRRHEFIVYRMSDKFSDGKNQLYTLYFVSEEYIANLKYKVSKSYRGKLNGDIVNDIYTKFISNKVSNPKDLHIDDSVNQDSAVYTMHFVMGNFRPFQAINLVAKRSVPGRGLGKYIFYEDKSTFNFKSVESLLDPIKPNTDLDREIKENPYGGDSTLENPRIRNAVFEGKNIRKVETPADPKLQEIIPVAVYVLVPSNAHPVDLDTGEQNISTFKFSSTFDVISNLVGGMYGSRLLTYDPISHRIGTLNNLGAKQSFLQETSRVSSARQTFYDFNYNERYSQFKHIRGPSKPLATSNHIGANSPEACFKFMTTNLEHNEEGGTLKTIAQMQNRMTRGVLKSYDNQVERWLLTNYSHHRQLKNIVLDVRVPGDHNRTVGEIVEIKLPSAYFDEEHTFYRGNYLVSKIKHILLDSGKYEMEMQLIRDSLFSMLFDEEFGATEEELIDAGAPQSFIDALKEDNNTFSEDEAGEEP